MEHLFSAWGSFTADVGAADHVILLTDYDGTLTPIVSRPGDAVLPPDMRDLLTALAANEGISIGIVSGRALDDLKKMADIPGIYYGGNHGLEITGPGLNYVNPKAAAARTNLRTLGHELVAGLAGIAGVIIEEKGFSLSAHFRLVAPDEAGLVQDIFRQTIQPYAAAGKLRLTTGKMVLEARPPVDWDKGRAVLSIRERIEEQRETGRTAVIYCGDDTTDEDAFRVLPRPEGWSVYVGGEKPNSAAGYYLRDVAEMGQFLTRLENLTGAAG